VPQPGRSREEGADAPPPRAAADAAVDAEIHFDEPTERNYLDDLNPQAKRVANAYVEAALAGAPTDERFQFERHGYFVADCRNAAVGRPVYNRAVTLRDSWGKDAAGKR
jgi:hypothetical protein